MSDKKFTIIKIPVSRTEHYGFETITQQQEIAYDHRMRLKNIRLITNDDYSGNAMHYILKNTYDALGRLSKKELDNYSYPYSQYIAPLQTVNYAYNIRGWLTNINNPDELGNDLFAQKIQYTNYMQELGQTEQHAQYNGNISSIQWATAQGVEAYAYTYDKQNRITKAQYGYKGSTGMQLTNAYSEPTIQYDKHGNILSLQRYGAPAEQELIDDLEYMYIGNKLTAVHDKGHQLKGFANNAANQHEYDYDAAGNMIRDDNSHISKIEYNYLHLPKQITKENFTQTQADGTQKMVQQENTYFHYTAAGQKLMYECKTTYADGTQLRTQIMYEGIVVYKGTSTNLEQAPLLEIDYIHHPEGRIRVSKVNQALQFTYEYHLKDHLGNTRVAFDAVQTGTSIFYKHAVAFQATDYYSFGMEHEQPNPYAPTLGQEHNQNFRYNGKEYYSGIGWSDYGARFYNSSLGRWMSVDPLAEKYMSLSTYHFSGNNPVNLIDRNGMSWESWHEPLKKDFGNIMQDLFDATAGDVSVDIGSVLAELGKGNEPTPEDGERIYYGEGKEHKTMESARDQVSYNWGMKHNETSIKEDREYGSTIFKGSDKNGTYVVATVPKRANIIGKAMGTVNPSKPLNGEEVVGWVHSHGSSKSGSKDFNAFTSGGGDLIYGNNLGNKNIGFASYVITPGGFLNRAVTISQNIYWGTGTTTFQIQTIRNDLPSDLRDKFYENKTPYPINNSYTEEY